jgi:hypothetical protein
VKNLGLTRLISAALVAGFCAGCGYHFAASGVNLPADARTIHVARFDNQTRFTGVNDELMRYVKDEIAMHQRLVLVDDPARADLVLSGAVTFLDTTPVAFNSVLEPTIYHQTMTIRASLRDRRTGRTIWSTRGLSNVQNAPVVSQAVVATSPSFLQQNLRSQDIARLPDLQVAQTQTAAARDRMMAQIAQTLYASMASGF